MKNTEYKETEKKTDKNFFEKLKNFYLIIKGVISWKRQEYKNYF